MVPFTAKLLPSHETLMLKDCYPLGDNHEKEQGEKKEEKQSKRKIMTIISVEEYAVRVCQLFSHLKKKKKNTPKNCIFTAGLQI